MTGAILVILMNTTGENSLGEITIIEIASMWGLQRNYVHIVWCILQDEVRMPTYVYLPYAVFKVQASFSHWLSFANHMPEYLMIIPVNYNLGLILQVWPSFL